MIYIILLMLVTTTASADYYLKSAIVLHAVDWAQTLEIRKSEGMHESNRILGKHPSVKRVNTYFTVTGLACIAINYYLPKPIDKWFAISWFSNGLASVVGNYSIGVRVKF